MTPQTVNAYYNAGMNEIVFPAAILQDPFFDPDRDDAANYGAIGAFIGHEIGHGFDDRGSKYDGDGRLTDWRSATDRQAFEARNPVGRRAQHRFARLVQHGGAGRFGVREPGEGETECEGRAVVGVVETSDWYNPAVYPEIRSGPPWVMEDMIEAQVRLPEMLGGSLASSVPRLVEMLHAAAGAGEPIVVSAVGTSGHSARAVALILNGVMGESAVAAGPAEARESADEALAPRRKGLCIGISHGGLSTSTVRALAAARQASAKTALITAAGDTPAGTSPMSY